MKFRILILCFLMIGCVANQNQIIYQTSTIDALLAGIYDGETSCKTLLDHGDLGVGTFDGLDGEMAVIDGVIYQIKSDGKVYLPVASTKTPFATVCNFEAEKEFGIDPDSGQDKVKKMINQLAPNLNLFCAIKIKGEFSYMKTRSVPAQKKPYPPLAEVTKTQPVFEMKNVSGTIVGFRSPPFVKGINVPGYHWHFVSEDKDQGGHILDFVIKSGEGEIEVLDKYFLQLPSSNKAFADEDLSIDRSKELDKVEK